MTAGKCLRIAFLAFDTLYTILGLFFLIYIFWTIGTNTVLQTKFEAGTAYYTYLVLSFSIYFVATGIFGFVAGFRRGSCLLKIFLIFISLLMVTELILIITMYYVRSKMDIFTFSMWEEFNTDTKYYIQENLLCCGYSSRTEYGPVIADLPDSCFPPGAVKNAANVYTSACITKIYEWLDSSIGIAAYTFFILSVVIIEGMLLGLTIALLVMIYRGSKVWTNPDKKKKNKPVKQKKIKPAKQAKTKKTPKEKKDFVPSPCCLRMLRPTFLVFDILYWLFGMFLLIYIFWTIDTNSVLQTNFNAGFAYFSYVVLSFGIFIFVTGILGFLAIVLVYAQDRFIKVGRVLLIIFTVLMLILMVTELILGITTYYVRARVSAFRASAWTEFNAETKYHIQTELQCCGLIDSTEYGATPADLPDSCFPAGAAKTAPNTYSSGCGTKIDEWLYSAGGGAAVFFFIAFVVLLEIILVIYAVLILLWIYRNRKPPPKKPKPVKSKKPVKEKKKKKAAVAAVAAVHSKNERQRTPSPPRQRTPSPPRQRTPSPPRQERARTPSPPRVIPAPVVVHSSNTRSKPDTPPPQRSKTPPAAQPQAAPVQVVAVPVVHSTNNSKRPKSPPPPTPPQPRTPTPPPRTPTPPPRSPTPPPRTPTPPPKTPTPPPLTPPKPETPPPRTPTPPPPTPPPIVPAAPVQTLPPITHVKPAPDAYEAPPPSNPTSKKGPKITYVESPEDDYGYDPRREKQFKPVRY